MPKLNQTKVNYSFKKTKLRNVKLFNEVKHKFFLMNKMCRFAEKFNLRINNINNLNNMLEKFNICIIYVAG